MTGIDFCGLEEGDRREVKINDSILEVWIQ